MSEGAITITIVDRQDKVHTYDVPDDLGISVMELCKANDLPVQGTCGGMALCASCHIYIENETLLSVPNEDEEMMLDQVVAYQANSRLGCQIKLNAQADGLRVRLAPL